MKRNIEIITIGILIIATILLSFISLNTGFRISGFEKDTKNNRITIFFNKPISRELDLKQYVSINPEANLMFYNFGNRIDITLSNLELGVNYEVILHSDLPNLFNEVLGEPSAFRFQADSPAIAFLNIKDDTYKVQKYDLLSNKTTTLFETTNEIKSFSIRQNYLVVASINPKLKTNITISLINHQSNRLEREIFLDNSNLFKVELSYNEEFFTYISQPAREESGFVVPLDSNTITRLNIINFNEDSLEFQSFTPDILDAYITPDNAGMLLRGYDSTFFIKSFDAEDTHVTLSKFIGTGGFNKKGNQVLFTTFDPTLAYSSLPFITIYNSDRSTEDIKFEDSYIIDPVFLTESDFVYAKKIKDLDGTPGIFSLFQYNNGNEIELIEYSTFLESFELPKVSSDSKYFCYEKYNQVALLDYTNQRNFINQRKPKSASMIVENLDTKELLVEINNSFDCQWL